MLTAIWTVLLNKSRAVGIGDNYVEEIEVPKVPPRVVSASDVGIHPPYQTKLLQYWEYLRNWCNPFLGVNFRFLSF